MEEKKIEYRVTNTGHWMARCDHSSNVIELNEKEFFKLSPMHQDYIWVHEHVHLLYDVYDEEECNRIVDKIFIERAKDEKERAERVKMVMTSNETSLSKSYWIAALITGLIGIGTSVTKFIINKRNSGYYSLSENDRRVFVDQLLSQSFEASLLTDQQSAKDIFWSQMQPNISRKKEQEYSGWYAKNTFIDDYIDKYEQLYGFGFNVVTPVNKWAHPQYKKILKTAGWAAVGVAVLVLAIVLIKTKKK